ncbi:MAG: beta-hexosaminidase [Firmicutes bacterium]|nr:beta-hexosaminidase [Bacillota bacterium]
MSREEKVGQIFLARCPDQQAVETVSLLHLGGYVLFARDFDGLTTEQVSSRIDSYQQAAELPLFVAVDEEGGYVVRVSSNPALRYAPFASPRNVYLSGGLEALTADAREKGRLLSSLGINVDLAPVADVSTSPSDFIYDRALGENAETTAAAVAAQVEALEETGVSATLKHFPGYGNNGDTHNGVVTDNRPAQTFYEQDLLPFASGIAAGADFVLVSHNLVTAFDGSRPASLSPAIHQLLREELGFDGLIVTDDLAMGGVAQLYGVDETAVLALLAGNDLLLSSDPEQQIAAILRAMDTGRVSESLVDETVERILRAKIMAGLIPLPDGGTAAGEEADAAGAG